MKASERVDRIADQLFADASKEHVMAERDDGLAMVHVATARSWIGMATILRGTAKELKIEELEATRKEKDNGSQKQNNG